MDILVDLPEPESQRAKARAAGYTNCGIDDLTLIAEEASEAAPGEHQIIWTKDGHCTAALLWPSGRLQEIRNYELAATEADKADRKTVEWAGAGASVVDEKTAMWLTATDEFARWLPPQEPVSWEEFLRRLAAVAPTEAQVLVECIQQSPDGSTHPNCADLKAAYRATWTIFRTGLGPHPAYIAAEMAAANLRCSSPSAWGAGWDRWALERLVWAERAPEPLHGCLGSYASEALARKALR